MANIGEEIREVEVVPLSAPAEPDRVEQPEPERVEQPERESEPVGV